MGGMRFEGVGHLWWGLMVLVGFKRNRIFFAQRFFLLSFVLLDLSFIS